MNITSAATQRAHHKSGYATRILLLVVILIQLAGAVYLCNNTRAGGDGIFTFTLANTPYEFDYIVNKIERFPNSNGWMDAGIIKEQYMVMPYDRFNYSSVYWHQRIDNHPLLYYSAVHTICSLFPESYSIWYALTINIVALLIIDYILYRVAKLVFPTNIAAPVVLIATASSIVSVIRLAALARMYMLLALMTVWFLWICLRLVYRHKVSLWEIYFCVLLGSQTHYYYYVFAALCGFITLVMMLYDREWLRVWRILLTSGMAFCTSLILFPWVVWHIVFNQMDKNETLRMWDLDTLRSWLQFVNESIFNGNGILWIVLAVIVIVCTVIHANQMRNVSRARQDADLTMAHGNDGTIQSQQRFWLLTGLSTLLYSMVIYTLNGALFYYATPVYLPSAIMMTALIMNVWNMNAEGRGIAGHSAGIETAVCLALVLFLLRGLSSNLLYDVAAHVEYQEYLAFHQVALDYEGADCLYISTADDNMLQGMWFEFGEYDEFRKLPIEEYNEIVEESGDAALEEILSGRETSDTVILYIPLEVELPDGANRIAELNGFQVAVLYE